MNRTETQSCLRRVWNKSIRQNGFFGSVVLICGLTHLDSALAGEPTTVCAVPAVAAGGLTLLLDPVDHAPIALLSDPDTRLPINRWPQVLQTVRDQPDAAGLPHLKLTDVLPEFWAQPASLRPFLRGPEAYSGIGSEVRARDWAGFPFTDRRAYRLDSGLRSAPSAASLAPPGGGSIRVRSDAGSLRLAWSGIAGRVYQLHYTSNLTQPFQLIRTFIASEDSEAQFTVSINGSQGFYRLAEIAP